MGDVYPPREIFEREVLNFKTDVVKSLGGYRDDAYVKTIHPLEGGSYAYFANSPFPRKGHPYPEALLANNVIKRITLSLLMPLVSKQLILPAIAFLFVPYKYKLLEKILSNYARLAMSIYDNVPPSADGNRRNPLLKESYYNPLPKELWRLVYHFLLGIGITDDTAYKIGKILATIIHYDDSYYQRLADIFSEMNREKLLENPRKELLRVIGVYTVRINFASFRLTDYRGNKPGDNITQLSKLLSLVLLLPKYKKVFKESILKIDFTKLQADDADRYHSFNKQDYDACGISWENRKVIHDKIQMDFLNSLQSNSLTLTN